VVLSDPRLLTKRYGRELLDALPPAKRVIGAWSEVRGDVARFYRGRTAKA
jgi:ATP-dependent DNA helicase DinG